MASAQQALDILRQNCGSCHNAKLKTSGLSMDSREDLLAGGKRGKGLLLAAIRHEGELKMPPGRKLTPTQTRAIEQWLTAGAPWDNKSNQPHWAFQTIRRPAIPAAPGPRWGRNAIDAFIHQRLRKEGLSPSPEADASTLRRRMRLDLTGIPEDPFENSAADNLDFLADRLLASPHFGERWGRHWLDQARYADSDGGSRDEPRQIWKYRDWVVSAINHDLPFDQFLTQQIAGDQIPGATPDQIVATGFLRNHPIQIEAGTDREQYRVENVFDRADTVGTVFLGLSVGCARCHDHKFDPITQRNYYQLYAFFNNCDEWDNSKPLFNAAKNNLDDVHAPVLQLANGEKSMVYRELPNPREAYVMLGGDFLRKGPRVEPGFPQALPAAGLPSANRLDLARWLTDRNNPLTARVAVNRIWLQYFGSGLVETENDFGTQGARPSHPELLDWLASELMEGGWRMKRIHQLILQSAAYRQSSADRADVTAKDPGNRLLARQSRLRLDSEIVRDSGLTVSGLLEGRLGGPSVYPPQPANAMAASQVKKVWPTSTGANRYRRGLYTFFYRVTPHPALTVFDQPSASQACTRRNRSNTPLQALTLLNDVTFHEMAVALGRRVLTEAPGDDTARLDYAFRLCNGRTPSLAERDRLLRLLRLEYDALLSKPSDAALLAGRQQPGLAAWASIARVLMNTDEFITRE